MSTIFTISGLEKVLLLCALYGCCMREQLFAQTPVFDSLSTVLHTATNDTTKMRTLLALARQAEHTNLRLVDYYANQALMLSKKLLDTSAMTNSYCLLAASSGAKGARRQALSYCNQALELATLSNNARSLAAAYNQLSEEHRLALRYDSAVISAERSMVFALRVSDTVLYARASGNLGQIYVRQRRYAEAMAIFQRALLIFKRSKNDGDYISTLARLGYVQGLQGERTKELALYEEVYALSKNNGYTLDMVDITLMKGTALFHLKRYDDALPHLKYALLMADSLEAQMLKEESNLYLSQTYEALNQPSEALQYYKQFVSVIQRQQGDNTDQRILEIQRYEQLLKDQQMLLLQRESANERLKQITFVITVIAVLLLIFGVLLIWRTIANKRSRERDEELKIFAHYTNDVISRHDIHGLYQYVSPAVTALLGYNPSELIGQNPYPYLHPDDVNGAKKAYKQVITTKEPGLHTVRFRTKNGDYRWIEVTFKPLLDASGMIKEFVHTSRDVSGRVEAEQKLRTSEEALKATLNSTPNVAIQWFNENAEVVLWNNASEKFFGWSAEEAIGKTLDMLIYTPEEASSFKTMLQTIKQTGEVMGPFEYQYKHKDGTQGYGQSTTFAIDSSEPNTMEPIQLFVCMDIDITERKRAEEALYQVNHDMDTMLRMMSVGVAVNVNNRYVFTNEALRQILGYSDEEFQNIPIINYLIHDDDKPLVQKRYSERLNDVNSHANAVEIRYCHKNGHYVWVQVSGLLITYQSQKATLVTFVDITERRQIQDTLQQRERQLSALINNTSDVIFSIDPQYRFITFNTTISDSIQQFFGITLQPGIDALAIVAPTPELRGTWQSWYDRALQGEMFMIEHHFTLPAERYVELSFNPIRASSGGVEGVAVFYRDITPRKKAEMDLRESEERLRSIIEAMSEGLLLQDKNHKIIFANSALARMLDIGLDEVYQATIFDPRVQSIHDDGSPLRNEERPSVLALSTGQPQSDLTMGILKPDGTTLWMLVNAHPIFSPEESAPISVVSTFTDITKRKEIEISLRESEERLRSIVESISEGLILQNHAGIITFCNPAVTRILGVNDTDLLGSTSLEFQSRTFHEDGSPFLPTEYPANITLTTGEPQTDVVMGLAKPDGTLSWIAVNSRPLYHYSTDKESPSAVVITFFNITERRAAERRLRERELQLTALIESTSDTIYSIDRNYRLLIFNSAYKQAARIAFGVDIQTGMDILHLLPPSSAKEADVWKNSFDRVLAGERYATVYSHGFGSERTFTEIMFNPILNDDGIVNGVVAFNRDITPIKRAEERLRKSEDLLRQTSSIAQVGGWELNLRTTPPQMTWTETTYDICELPHGSPVEIQSILDQFGTAEHRTIVNHYLRTTVQFGEGFDCEIAQTTLRGKKLWVRILGNVEMQDSVAIRLYGTIQDITERKETELLIQEQLHALEAKTAEMERFIYTISHDLKSPLITIKGFLGMIQEDLQVQDYRRIPRDMQRIDNAANKMQQLLEDLLELSRVGRVINASEHFSMTVLANETVELLHGILTPRHIRVSVQPDMPRILGDKARFREVYQNLIENASKFMGQQAEPHIEIGVRRDDLQPIFYVRDNGIGIAKEYQDTIFGLFDKLDQHSDGTGIGLALIKRIIELHGGRIWVESAPGEGATFYFTCKADSIEETIPK